MAGNAHVISVGVDLVPALQSHCGDAKDVLERITERVCVDTAKRRFPTKQSNCSKVLQGC